MYDSAEELLARNRLGEDSTFERKAVAFRGEKCIGPRRDDLADELAAFANSNQAVLVLGIADDGAIQGVPVDCLDSVTALVRDICKDSIKPPLNVKLTRMRLPDASGAERIVIKVDIPRSLFVHKSPGGYLYRHVDSRMEMSPDLLARLFQQRSQARIIRFDEQAVPDASLADLDPALWARFLPEGDPDARRTLHKMRLLVDEDGEERATVAGVLLCSHSPEQWISGAYIQAVCYRGVERDAHHQVDARDIRGPLDEQVAQSIHFIRRNMKIAAVKEPWRREMPQFSVRACFEAMVNAVAHRDYSISGSRIRLHLFDDRMEIFSPGPLPNTVSIESLPLRQATRNELVASLLARCPVTERKDEVQRSFLMDKRGEGVPIILRETEKLTGRLPVYELIDNTELLLRIPAYTPDFD